MKYYAVNTEKIKDNDRLASLLIKSIGRGDFSVAPGRACGYFVSLTSGGKMRGGRVASTGSNCMAAPIYQL